jgi:hypothetical protein
MANNPKFSNAAVNAEADAVARLLDNGYFRIYSGTQPATADTALSGNTLLAELRYAATSAPAASAGVLTFNAVTSDTSADATGTASFFRSLKSDGTSAVMDGTVGTSAADAIINSTAIQAGTQVDVTSHTFTVSKG